MSASPCPPSLHPELDGLSGIRIGFFTSVVGMGGSEVLVADAMEAAFNAGATVVAWSEQNAALRSICAERSQRLSVEHFAWPAKHGHTPATDVPAVPAASPQRRRVLSSAWRAWVPIEVKRRLGFTRDASRFAKELRRYRPDLLFVNVNGSEAISLAGPIAGVPVVNCYHLSYTRPEGGTFSRFETQRQRRATMHSGQVAIHTSAAARDEWSRIFDYPLSRTRLIYNGVDRPLQHDRRQVRAEVGLKDDEFAFCVPGRLHPMKGHAHLIEAVRRIKGSFDRARVLICGEGSLQNELKAASDAAGLQGTVQFLGFRSDLPRILQGIDCVVLPSVSSENLSVAVLEALMAGAPAIVTKVGGMAEAVKHQESGFVVPPADPEALGQYMLQMLHNRERARDMGAAARCDALTRFTRDRMMAEYVDVFRQVCACPVVST